MMFLLPKRRMSQRHRFVQRSSTIRNVRGEFERRLSECSRQRTENVLCTQCHGVSAGLAVVS